MSTPFDTLRRELEAWTGFPHVVLVQSGSAALKLGLRVLVPEGRRVALPALACWTLTGSIMDLGFEPQYLDVDRHLGLATGSEDSEAIIGLDPWGTCCDWSAVRSSSGVKLLDLTLSILGGCPDTRAADVFDGAIISLGRGKPLDIGAGGILLLRNRTAQLEAQVHLLYGRQKLRWATRTDRYVFADGLLHSLVERWHRLSKTAGYYCEVRQEWTKGLASKSLPLSVADCRPGTKEGITSLIPVLLAPGFPLNAKDVFVVAMAEAVPLVIQPVSPPYLEPAVKGQAGVCPVAEGLADRLLFVPSQIADKRILGRLELLFRALEKNAPAFARPYHLSEKPVEIPDAYAHWRRHGIVCRGLDGSYYVHDPLDRKLYRVNEGVVAALQEESED